MTEPVQSVDGWVVFVAGLHSEVGEDDVYDTLAEFGKIKSLYLNFYPRTGLTTGSCVTKFCNRESAQAAVDASVFLCGHKVSINWAFVKGTSR